MHSSFRKAGLRHVINVLHAEPPSCESTDQGYILRSAGIGGRRAANAICDNMLVSDKGKAHGLASASTPGWEGGRVGLKKLQRLRFEAQAKITAHLSFLHQPLLMS